MVFEVFLRWLTHRSRCKHEWVQTGFIYSLLRDMFTETGFRDTYKCNKCGKKEKRTPRDAPNVYYY